MPSEEDLGIGTFQHILPRPQHYEDSGSSQTVALWPFYSALRTVMGVEGEPTSFDSLFQIPRHKQYIQ